MLSCAEEVGEQLNMLSCFSVWSSSELRHVATTHCFHKREKHLTGEISVPVRVAQHRCPLSLWGLTKGSVGVPVYDRAVSTLSTHYLCNCAWLHLSYVTWEWTGCSEEVLMHVVQPPCNIDPCLGLPGKLVLDLSCRNPSVSLMSACCVPRFYYNITIQWPVILEKVRNWFFYLVLLVPVLTEFKMLSGMSEAHCACRLCTLCPCEWLCNVKNPGRELGLI